MAAVVLNEFILYVLKSMCVFEIKRSTFRCKIENESSKFGEILGQRGDILNELGDPISTSSGATRKLYSYYVMVVYDGLLFCMV